MTKVPGFEHSDQPKWGEKKTKTNLQKTYILWALGILTPMDPSGAREGSENSARTSDSKNDDSSKF